MSRIRRGQSVLPPRWHSTCVARVRGRRQCRPRRHRARAGSYLLTCWRPLLGAVALALTGVGGGPSVPTPCLTRHMVARTNLFVPPATPYEYRPAGEPRPTKTRPAAGAGPQKPPDGGQTVLADQMACAIAREAGVVGRYDVARRLYRDKEAELLGRVVRGSARAFSELDQLRRGPLYFPPTRFEGAVDFGPGAPSHAMRPNGDFRLGINNTGDDVSQHPAVRGGIPRIRQRQHLTAGRDTPDRHPAEKAIAAPSTPGGLSAQTPLPHRHRHERDPSPSQSPFIGAGVLATTVERRSTAGKPAGVWNGAGRLPEGKRHLAERRHLPGCASSSTVAGQRQQRDELTVETTRPLPAGWAKLRSRTMPTKEYYHDARTGQSQWERPSLSRANHGSSGSYDGQTERQIERQGESERESAQPVSATRGARETRNNAGSRTVVSSRSHSADGQRKRHTERDRETERERGGPTSGGDGQTRPTSVPDEFQPSKSTTQKDRQSMVAREGGSDSDRDRDRGRDRGRGKSRGRERPGHHGHGVHSEIDPAVVWMQQQPAAGAGSWSGLQLSQQRVERAKHRASSKSRVGRRFSHGSGQHHFSAI